MVITIFIVIPLCYPAFDTYYLNSIKEDTSKSFFWESPSSRTPITEEIFAEKCGTKPPLRVQQIKISTTKNNKLQNVLEKDMLLWTLNLQEQLSTTSITYPHNTVSPLISSVLIEANNKNNPKKDPLPYTLSNLCFKPINDNRCLIHSPLEYWSNNAQRLLKDHSIFNTISKANKTNSFDIPIPIDSVFGNPVYDKRTGKIISADSIILTYFFKDIGDDCNEGETIAIWEMLWKKMAEDDSHSHYPVDLDSGRSNISAEVVLLIVEYLILFSYISLSLRRLNSVKSKIGLAFSTIAQLLASLIISLRLEGVGNSITKNVVTRLLLLPLSCVINVDSLQEFCIFISVTMITDYLLQMSLYITILSIDLRRLEISDLYNRKVITPITKSNNIRKLSVSALLIITSLTNAYKVKTDLLSLTFVSDFFGNSTVPESNLNTTLWETSTATTTDKFWDIVNPQKSDQYFEFRPMKFISIIQNFDGADTNNQSNNNQKSNNNETTSTSTKYFATPRVVTLRGCHSADVDLLCANSYNKIISTGIDKHITSWNGKRGIPLKKLERYLRRCDTCKCKTTGGRKKCISWPVRAMCMSEQTDLAAAGFEDGVVRVWDLNSGQAMFILKDTVEDVESSSLSSLENNKSSVILLATYRNGYFREWDLVSGQVVHTIFTHQKGGITYLCVVGEDEKQDYNHDKLVVFTGARDGSVKCWARNIHYSHNNESTPSNHHNNSNDSSSSQPHKFRWDLLYTIPGRPNYAITCIATKIIKKDSIGILVTGTSDGQVNVYDYRTSKLIVTLSKGLLAKQKSKKKHKKPTLQKHSLLQQQYQKSCPCGNTEEPGGFTIVTSSVDEKVLVWQLVRNVMDCTCISLNFDYHLSNNKANKKNLSPSSITSVTNNINDNLTRFKNNVSNQLNNHQKVAEWNGVVSYQSKFIGHISQLGGSAIVLAREHVVGVRKVKNSKNKQCHGAEGEWEVWMLDINEPQAIESNNLCTGDNNDIDNEDEDEEDDLVELSVQTISLVNEKDLFEEQQKHKNEQLKLQEKASSVELKGFVRKPQKRCGSVMINKVNSDNDKSRNNNGSEQSLLNFEDENDKNEILPFAYIRQVVKVGEEGVAVAYGNFIKVVYFEGSSDDDELIDNDVS
nr:7446_t:CDS:2 [Entrophospora candida]